MTNSKNQRNLESPLASIAAFYKQKLEEWLRYSRYYLFGFIDGNPYKPCLILGCGKQEKMIDIQTALLMREALKKEPALLDNLLDGWLVANAGDLIAMSSSGTAKPKRRLGKKPKSTFVANSTAQTSIGDQQVLNSISDAIDSVPK